MHDGGQMGHGHRRGLFEFETLMDGDGDGVMAWNDCVFDPLIGANLNDCIVMGLRLLMIAMIWTPIRQLSLSADCDGIATADDCDADFIDGSPMMRIVMGRQHSIVMTTTPTWLRRQRFVVMASTTIAWW